MKTKFMFLKLAVVALLVTIGVESAFATATVTTATGGSAISADTAAAGGTGAYTTMTGPVISETDSAGMSGGTGAGGNSIILNAPAGFEFDTTINSVTVTIGGSGGTGGVNAFINTANSTSGDVNTSLNVTPTSSTITIYVTVASTQSFGTRLSTFTWSGIKVRPTSASSLATGNITYGGTSTGVATGTNMGTLTEVAGTVVSLGVETAANGGGSMVGTQNVTAGNSVPVYAVARDAHGNASNPSVTWSLTGTSGGVVSGDLTPASGTSSTFTGHLTGSATVHAALASPALTANSGTLTVVFGPIASYTVTASTPQTRGTSFSVTVAAKDTGGNTVTTDNSTVVTMTSSTDNVQFTGNPATLSSGTSTLSSVDNYFEAVTITVTDGNSKTGTSSSITVNPISGDYRSRVTGQNWATANTWETYNGSIWSTAGSAPTSATTGLINVRSPHTVTVAASVTARNLVIDVGATTSIANNQTFTVYNGVANGVISDGTSNNGILVVTNGTLVLSGTNTYNGTVINSGGIVSISTDNNLGAAAGGLTLNGGTLQSTGTNIVTIARTVTLGTGGGTLNIGVPIYFAGAISGGGGLTTGGNDLVLNRASGNNAIGPITVNSGRLFVFSGTNSIGNSSIAVQGGATLDFGIGGNTIPSLNTMTFASGSCLANRAGTLTVSTTKVTFPTAGTMIFNSDDQNTTNIIVNGTYPTLAGDLTIQDGPTGLSTVGNVTLNGAISGGFGLTKTSTGTLIFSSANTYSGGTTISVGALTANATGSLGSGTVTVANGATLTLANSTTQTLNGDFINNGTFTPGTSTVVFSGTAGQSVGGVSGATFYNLTVNSGASVALATNIVIGTGGAGTINGGFDCSAFVVSGAGSFTLASGGTFGIGDPNGITPTASGTGSSAGSIRTTTRSFSGGANYVYKGTATQVTGLGLPATISNLTNNNTASTLALSQVTTVTNTVSLNSAAKLSIPASTTSFCTKFVIGAAPQLVGSWGNMGSGASRTNSVNFANTGKLNVGKTTGIFGQQSAQLTASGNAIIVKFFGVQGLTYIVQRNTNLVAGAGWLDISTNLAGAGPFFYTNNPAPPSAFYQLKWQP